MESALDWMKKFDTRYRKTFDSKESPATQKTLQPPKLQQKKRGGGQRTLKSFLPKKLKIESELFDDTFSPADFALVTRRWKDKNSEHVAAQ